jgi:hypothetical protein
LSRRLQPPRNFLLDARFLALKTSRATNYTRFFTMVARLAWVVLPVSIGISLVLVSLENGRRSRVNFISVIKVCM